MLQRIDVLVMPHTEEGDYDAFRTLIKLLPRSYGSAPSYPASLSVAASNQARSRPSSKGPICCRTIM